VSHTLPTEAWECSADFVIELTTARLKVAPVLLLFGSGGAGSRTLEVSGGGQRDGAAARAAAERRGPTRHGPIWGVRKPNSHGGPIPPPHANALGRAYSPLVRPYTGIVANVLACLVSFTDSSGIKHTAEVAASSLYEAAALEVLPSSDVAG